MSFMLRSTSMKQNIKFDPTIAHKHIVEFLDGDQAAFEPLEPHLDWLCRQVIRMLEGNPDEVDDYVQSSIVKIWKELPKYDRDPTNLRSWLWSIIHNHVISEWRKKNPLTIIPLHDEMVSDDHIEAEPQNDTTPFIIKELSTHLVKRFPAVRRHYLEVAAEVTVDALSGGKSAKSTIRDIRAELFPKLRSTQVVIIFYAAVVWLRIRSFDPEYIETPPPEAIEWSLVPELRTVVGERLSSVLYTLFKGGSIHFRVN